MGLHNRSGTIINPSRRAGGSVIYDSAPGSPSHNRSAIQGLLDNNGHIMFLGDSTYEIDAALEINSDTLLDLGNCTIKQADGSHDNMMRTSAHNATKTAVSALTWATGTCTATTSTAHGLVPGDWVSIIGVTIAGYGGVFEVLTTTDTTHFTYAVADIATTPSTGTITCVKANVNITITGGTWDYNTANQTTTGTTQSFGHILAHINNLRVNNLNYLNTRKFCFFPFGLNNFIFDTIYFNSTSDCIHCNGPLRNGQIRNVSGTGGDDCIVLMSAEDTVLYAYAALSAGDIINVVIDGANFKTTTSVIALFTPGPVAYIYDGIIVKNIGGETDSSGIKIHAVLASSNYAQSIVIENVAITPTGDQSIISASADTEIRNLAIKNVTQTRPTHKNIPVHIVQATIDSLVIDNITLPSGWNSNGSDAAWGFQSTSAATISQMVVKNLSATLGVSTRKCTYVECGHTGDSVKMTNCDLTGGLRLLYLTTNATIGAVMMQNITTNDVVEGLRLVDQSCDVTVDGFAATAALSSRYGIKIDGAGETNNLHLNGFTALPGATITMLSLAGTVNIYAPGFTWDVNDFNSALVGQQCIHDGTARGTMVAGSCGNTGGTWYNFSDPLNDVWTP